MRGSWTQRERAFGTFEVRGGVHVGEWPLLGELDANLHASLERAQLFEFLDQLEPRGLELRELSQCAHAIRVDADVPQAGRGQRRRRIAIPRNRRAREIQCAAGAVTR